MNIFTLTKDIGTHRYKIILCLWGVWQIIKVLLGIIKLNLLNIIFISNQNIIIYGKYFIFILIAEFIFNWILNFFLKPEELEFQKNCFNFLIKECGMRYVDDLEYIFKSNNPYDKCNQANRYIFNNQYQIKNMFTFVSNNLLTPLIWVCTQNIFIGVLIFTVRLIVSYFSNNIVKFIKKLNIILNKQFIQNNTKGRKIFNEIKYLHYQDKVFQEKIKVIDQDRNNVIKTEKYILYHWLGFDISIDIPDILLTYVIMILLSKSSFNSITLLLIFSQIRKMMSSIKNFIHILKRYSVDKSALEEFFNQLNKIKKIDQIKNFIDFNKDIEAGKNIITLENIKITLKKVKYNKKKNKNILPSFFNYITKCKKNKIEQEENFKYNKIELKELTLNPGELTALKGIIGSGKSTLLKALTQFNDSTKEIIVKINNKKYSINSLQLFISYSPQEENFNQYDDILTKDVLSGFPAGNINDSSRKDLLKEIIIGICNEIPHFKKCICTKNNDLDSEIDTFLESNYNVIKPSGGQKCLLTIIRHLYVTIARNKKILIIDEIDKAIKDEDAKSLWNFLKVFMKKYDVHMIYVSHHPSTYDFADQFICFDNNGPTVKNN